MLHTVLRSSASDSATLNKAGPRSQIGFRKFAFHCGRHLGLTDDNHLRSRAATVCQKRGAFPMSICENIAFGINLQMVEYGVTDQIVVKPRKKATEDHIAGRFG